MNRTLDGLRILLGAVMVVTAIRFFLPPLLPFVPATSWDGVMSNRLMTAFDRSGLLAVAKFIHLAGGALLLTNRAVPFALAAMLPVNVCGLFISLFIEGDPLLSVLAVLTVALNGLLMLGYLPFYRTVFERGQLADGEGPEDGQNYESLFANPFINTPPAAYLGGALVLAAAFAFYWFVVPFANGTMGLFVLAVPALVLAAGALRALSRRRTS